MAYGCTSTRRPTSRGTSTCNVQLGSDPDLLQQTAAHIVCVARRTNVSVDEVIELFISDSSFASRAQKTFRRLPQIFTGGECINETKYMDVRSAIRPLIVYEKRNMQHAAAVITSGSLTHLSSNLAGLPTAPAAPAAAPPKRKSALQIYLSAPSASDKKQKSSGGASSGTNPHESGAAAAAASSSSAGAGAGAGTGASARDAITVG